jgi:hypothetical protein
MHPKQSQNKSVQKYLTWLLILCIIVGATAHYKKNILPPNTEIDDRLLQSPVQTTIDADEFSFNYRETDYFVKPLAEYELYGLVASHNNINALWNIYHDSDSVDIKDLCVVWGKNIETEAYLDTKIKNTAWTCWFQYGAGVPFQHFELSNNHLLASKKQVRETIRKVNVGHQIKLKGKLVDYGEAPNEYYRKTSLSRTDTDRSSRGGGACEVFYIEEIEIIKSTNGFWHALYKWIIRLFLVILLLKGVFFFNRIHKQSIMLRNHQSD